MSAEWSVVTIDEIKSNDKGAIAIGPFGSRMKSDCYVANGIPVIRGTNITGGPSFGGEFVFITRDKADELGSCNVYKDDLVFPHRGSIGEVGIILSDERYVISSSLMKLTCDKKKADPKFLYYFFKSKNGRHELLKNASQVGTPGIGQPLASLKSISLKLPPLATQNRISDVLTSLDKKVHLNTQTNQTLESIAQAIFKSWFVDFEPVKAKMAAKERWHAMQSTSESASPVCYAEEAAIPDLETYTNLAVMCAISGKNETELAQLQQQNPDHYQQLAETAALFPSAMVDSELGEIPEGWEVTPIGNLLESTIGGDWGKDKPDEKHQVRVKIIRGTDIPNIKTCNDNAVPVRFVEEKKLKNRSLRFGDVVIEVSGGSPTQPTGRSILISKEILERMDYPVAPASFCRLFRPISVELGYFIGIYLQIIYAEGKTWLYQNQSTGISNFQTTVFLEKELLAMPDTSLINCFVKTISPIIGKMDSNENSKLAELRDSLLPKLLSGEIDFTNIQSEME